MSKPLSILFAAAIFAGSATQGFAQDCPSGMRAIPLSGKISNNSLIMNELTGESETLGVAHVVFDKDKMKCAVHGVGTVLSGVTDLVHTIVCDDSVKSWNPYIGQFETIHSQATLHTNGYFMVPTEPCIFPFQEISEVVSGTGRGVFENVEQGELLIDGTANCQDSIDMKFNGYVCLPE